MLSDRGENLCWGRQKRLRAPGWHLGNERREENDARRQNSSAREFGLRMDGVFSRETEFTWNGLFLTVLAWKSLHLHSPHHPSPIAVSTSWNEEGSRATQDHLQRKN